MSGAVKHLSPRTGKWSTCMAGEGNCPFIDHEDPNGGHYSSEAEMEAYMERKIGGGEKKLESPGSWLKGNKSWKVFENPSMKQSIEKEISRLEGMKDLEDDPRSQWPIERKIEALRKVSTNQPVEGNSDQEEELVGLYREGKGRNTFVSDYTLSSIRPDLFDNANRAILEGISAKAQDGDSMLPRNAEKRLASARSNYEYTASLPDGFSQIPGQAFIHRRNREYDRVAFNSATGEGYVDLDVSAGKNGRLLIGNESMGYIETRVDSEAFFNRYSNNSEGKPDNPDLDSERLEVISHYAHEAAYQLDSMNASRLRKENSEIISKKAKELEDSASGKVESLYLEDLNNRYSKLLEEYRGTPMEQELIGRADNPQWQLYAVEEHERNTEEYRKELKRLGYEKESISRLDRVRIWFDNKKAPEKKMLDSSNLEKYKRNPYYSSRIMLESRINEARRTASDKGSSFFEEMAKEKLRNDPTYMENNRKIKSYFDAYGDRIRADREDNKQARAISSQLFGDDKRYYLGSGEKPKYLL